MESAAQIHAVDGLQKRYPESALPDSTTVNVVASPVEVPVARLTGHHQQVHWDGRCTKLPQHPIIKRVGQRQTPPPTSPRQPAASSEKACGGVHRRASVCECPKGKGVLRHVHRPFPCAERLAWIAQCCFACCSRSGSQVDADLGFAVAHIENRDERSSQKRPPSDALCQNPPVWPATSSRTLPQPPGGAGISTSAVELTIWSSTSVPLSGVRHAEPLHRRPRANAVDTPTKSADIPDRLRNGDGAQSSPVSHRTPKDTSRPESTSATRERRRALRMPCHRRHAHDPDRGRPDRARRRVHRRVVTIAMPCGVAVSIAVPSPCPAAASGGPPCACNCLHRRARPGRLRPD